jgi:hypothetical protein
MSAEGNPTTLVISVRCGNEPRRQTYLAIRFTISTVCAIDGTRANHVVLNEGIWAFSPLFVVDLFVADCFVMLCSLSDRCSPPSHPHPPTPPPLLPVYVPCTCAFSLSPLPHYSKACKFISTFRVQSMMPSKTMCSTVVVSCGQVGR